jgi:hypothetical protein
MEGDANEACIMDVHLKQCLVGVRITTSCSLFA